MKREFKPINLMEAERGLLFGKHKDNPPNRETFGSYIKTLREIKGISLREFCRKTGRDKGNHSKLENGLRIPPKDPLKLNRLASDLGYERGSDEWVKMRDLAFKSYKDELDAKANKILEEVAMSIITKKTNSESGIMDLTDCLKGLPKDSMEKVLKKLKESTYHGFFIECQITGCIHHDIMNSNIDDAAEEFANYLYFEYQIEEPEVEITDLASEENPKECYLYKFQTEVHFRIEGKEKVK